MFKHILFTTDESAASFKAFPHALSLAKTYDGRISIVNVHSEFLDPEERQFLRVSNERFQEMIKEKAQKARKGIEKRLAEFNVDVPVEIYIREGNPRQKICELCRELDADVVVMATRGHSGLEAFVVGSVTEHVVRNSPIPVLVVHE